MEYEKLEIPVDENEVKKSVKDKLEDLRKVNKCNTELRRVQEGLINDLIETCVRNHTVFVVEMQNIYGRYRITSSMSYENFISNGCHVMSDTIKVKHIPMFWKTFDDFFCSLREIGVQVTVSETASLTSHTVLMYKTIIE